MPMPDFFTSPYFVPEPDNWHLKDGAPEEVRKEFEEYMKFLSVICEREDLVGFSQHMLDVFKKN